MRVCQTIAAVNAKDAASARRIKLDDFDLEFGRTETEVTDPVEPGKTAEVTVAKQVALLSAQTKGRDGKPLPITMRVVDKNGALVSERVIDPGEFPEEFR